MMEGHSRVEAERKCQLRAQSIRASPPPPALGPVLLSGSPGGIHGDSLISPRSMLVPFPPMDGEFSQGCRFVGKNDAPAYPDAGEADCRFSGKNDAPTSLITGTTCIRCGLICDSFENDFICCYC